MKRVRIRSYFGPHFPAFRLNSNSMSLRIQSECGKMRTRITPNTDTLRRGIYQTSMIKIYYGSQNVTTGMFELRTFLVQFSFLSH